MALKICKIKDKNIGKWIRKRMMNLIKNDRSDAKMM